MAGSGRRKYVPVGSGPESLRCTGVQVSRSTWMCESGRATVSEKTFAVHVASLRYASISDGGTFQPI